MRFAVECARVIAIFAAFGMCINRIADAAVKDDEPQAPPVPRHRLCYRFHERKDGLWVHMDDETPCSLIPVEMAVG